MRLSAKTSLLQFQIQNLISGVNYSSFSNFRNSRNSSRETQTMSLQALLLHNMEQRKESKNSGEKQWIKEIENTYQCKQDCGISHFGNHETHDFDVPRNKAMRLIKTHTYSPKFFTISPIQNLFTQMR